MKPYLRLISASSNFTRRVQVRKSTEFAQSKAKRTAKKPDELLALDRALNQAKSDERHALDELLAVAELVKATLARRPAPSPTTSSPTPAPAT